MNKKTFGLLVAGCATAWAVCDAHAKLVQSGWIQDYKLQTCVASNTCKLEFAAAGALGKLTYIETISCSIKIARSTSLKPVITRIQLNQSHQNGVHVFIAPLQIMDTTASDIKYQVYASGLTYMVPAGSKPQVIVDLSGQAPAGSELICAYTGKQDQ